MNADEEEKNEARRLAAVVFSLSQNSTHTQPHQKTKNSKPDSTGAPSRSSRGRAGRLVFDDEEEEEGIRASEYDDDDDEDDLSPASSSRPKKKAVSSKKASSSGGVFGVGDVDDDDGIDDDDEEILDETSALAAATLASSGEDDEDDDDDGDGGAKSDPLLAAAAAVSAVGGDDDEEEEDDDLGGLLDAAATLPGPSSRRPSPAVAGSTSKRRSSAPANAADPLSALIGLPDEYDGGDLEEGADGIGGVGEEEEEDELPEELPDIEYPEPPRRERALGQLLAAAGVEVASSLPSSPSSSSSLDEITVSGIEDEVSLLVPGDLFSTQATAAKTSPAALARELSRAAAAGAVAALVPESYAASLGALFGGGRGSVPLPLPVVFVAAAAAAAAASVADAADSPDSPSPSSSSSSSNDAAASTSINRAAGAVAREFYDNPTARMSTVLFVGGPGKTTSAWLTRGVLEEAGALVGMISSIEYALHADRLDARGQLWVADEEDPTESRECSAAFHLAPYKGKYPLPASDSTALRIQKVSAGMADRGATAAVIEVSARALIAGAAEGLDADVAVFTGSPEKSAAATEAKKRAAAAAVAASSNSNEDASASSSGSSYAPSASDAATDAALAAAEALVIAEGDAELAALSAVFESLTDSDRQRAVINLDDLNGVSIRDAAARGGAPAIAFGFYNTSADVKLSRVRFGLWETEVLVRTPIGSLSLSTQLVCRHNAFNVLASVAAGLAVTVPGGSGASGAAAAADDSDAPSSDSDAEADDESAFSFPTIGSEEEGRGGRALDLRTIVRGIEATEVIPGRTEAIDEGQPFAVIVDSARTPDALGRLLDGIREAGAKRLIVVLGCEGGRPRAARPYMGEVAHFKADIVIVTSDNPRGEDPRAIVADVVSGFPDEILKHNAQVPYPPGFLQDPGRVSEAEVEFLWDACYQHARYVCEDRWMAIRWAVGTAAADDAVLIVGKGSEDFQEWVRPGKGGETVRGWFDDRVEARHALVKAAELWSVSALDRSELPWMEWDEREARL